ncbi:hypothetical protein ACTL6P_22510 [Endozoicomonas acroporae]|uniref:hypothetical protein n=1 Tax=Endozoicomonas acroporae TaxID=1701104 RepID=UPI000C78722F|nr:hypothetical protein [Endozoicomonas acroporae]
MDVKIHGLAAFSYTWNKERDDQGSMAIAFARAVMTISIGIKINGNDVRAMLQDHPTSNFVRLVSKRPALSNLLYTDDSVQQQLPTLSTAQGRELNPLDINTTELTCFTDISGEPTTSATDAEKAYPDENGAELDDKGPVFDSEKHNSPAKK